MRKDFEPETEKKITFLTGGVHTLHALKSVRVRMPFDGEIMSFLNEVSGRIMSDSRAKEYPDVITFGFWIRKGHIQQLREQYVRNEKPFRMGK